MTQTEAFVLENYISLNLNNFENFLDNFKEQYPNKNINSQVFVNIIANAIKEVNINEEIYNKLKELNFNFELSKSGEYINVLLFIFKRNFYNDFYVKNDTSLVYNFIKEDFFNYLNKDNIDINSITFINNMVFKNFNSIIDSGKLINNNFDYDKYFYLISDFFTKLNKNNFDKLNIDDYTINNLSSKNKIIQKKQLELYYNLINLNQKTDNEVNKIYSNFLNKIKGSYLLKNKEEVKLIGTMILIDNLTQQKVKNLMYKYKMTDYLLSNNNVRLYLKLKEYGFDINKISNDSMNDNLRNIFVINNYFFKEIFDDLNYERKINFVNSTILNKNKINNCKRNIENFILNRDNNDFNVKNSYLNIKTILEFLNKNDKSLFNDELVSEFKNLVILNSIFDIDNSNLKNVYKEIINSNLIDDKYKIDFINNNIVKIEFMMTKLIYKDIKKKASLLFIDFYKNIQPKTNVNNQEFLNKTLNSQFLLKNKTIEIYPFIYFIDKVYFNHENVENLNKINVFLNKFYEDKMRVFNENTINFYNDLEIKNLVNVLTQDNEINNVIDISNMLIENNIINLDMYLSIFKNNYYKNMNNIDNCVKLKKLIINMFKLKKLSIQEIMDVLSNLKDDMVNQKMLKNTYSNNSLSFIQEIEKELYTKSNKDTKKIKL